MTTKPNVEAAYQ